MNGHPPQSSMFSMHSHFFSIYTSPKCYRGPAYAENQFTKEDSELDLKIKDENI